MTENLQKALNGQITAELSIHTTAVHVSHTKKTYKKTAA